MTLSAPEGLDPVDVSLDERVEVVRMQSFSLDTRAYGSQSWPIAVGVDATTWAAATLVVVVHVIDGFAPDTMLEIAVEAIELDPDDPKQLFTGAPVANVVLDSATAAGATQLRSLTPPWGSRLQVVLRPFQRAAEADREQRCTLTILLLGRRQGIIGAPTCSSSARTNAEGAATRQRLSPAWGPFLAPAATLAGWLADV